MPCPAVLDLPVPLPDLPDLLDLLAELDGAPGGSEVDTCTNTMIIANGLQV